MVIAIYYIQLHCNSEQRPSLFSSYFPVAAIFSVFSCCFYISDPSRLSFPFSVFNISVSTLSSILSSSKRLTLITTSCTPVCFQLLYRMLIMVLLIISSPLVKILRFVCRLNSMHIELKMRRCLLFKNTVPHNFGNSVYADILNGIIIKSR